MTENKNNLIPLISISGLTLFSVGGLIFFKSKTDQNIISPKSDNQKPPPNVQVNPTQVPKSIEHYLLASQQFFTQALEAQNLQRSPETITNLINRSLNFATEAITLFPQDFRPYLQRGNIYRSLTTPTQDTLNAAIADLSKAYQLNPTLAETTRTLASLYAQKGDAGNTLYFLTKTVSLEPTKAQNFYDLARLQQQAGHISAAVNTYSQLLTILTDPNQKTQVETEKTVLEKLLSQTSPEVEEKLLNPSPTTQPLPITEGNTLQADNLLGLVIAAPEPESKISVKNQTDSNSLSANAIIPKGQKSISITNTNLNSSSQVYVSTISGGKNLTLEVQSKSKDSFTVGLIDPAPEDINFKWWIVN